MLFENRLVHRQTRNIFRTIIMTIIFFFFLSFNNLIASQATVTFEPSRDDRVRGYKIYYGLSTHISNIIDVGSQVTYTVSNLQQGATYYFAATAYDKYGNESRFSEVVTYKVPEKNPPRSFYGRLGGGVEKPPDNLDLSIEGLSDWAHWGLDTASCFNRKAGITQQIGNFTRLGRKAPGRFTDARVDYSWFDGRPTSRITRTTAGIYFKNIGNGFQIRVPASTFNKTLKIYLGGYKAKGRFEAILTNDSVPPYVVYIDNPNGIIDRVITLNFAASGQADLIIRYSLEDDYRSGGNITLQAATLH